MPIVLVVLKRGPTSAEIYKLSSIFYTSVVVETYVKSGPAQCFLCQRFGHGSSNCQHPPRCAKCSGGHSAKDCLKKSDQASSCCDCGGDHLTNYRGCPYYQHILETTNSSKPKAKPLTQTTISPPTQVSSPATSSKNYAKALTNTTKNQLHQTTQSKFQKFSLF